MVMDNGGRWLDAEDDLFASDEGAQEKQSAAGLAGSSSDVAGLPSGIADVAGAAENADNTVSSDNTEKSENGAPMVATNETFAPVNAVLNTPTAAGGDSAERYRTLPAEGGKSRRGFGEPEKPVRGKMLKKLLKYDYRALFKFLLPAYIVLLSLAAVLGICLATFESNSFEDGVRFLVGFVVTYAMGIFCVAIVCVVNIATRYQKNLFSDEGYLTLTIPATPEEHIFSKLISGFTTILLTVAVAGVSVFILAFSAGLGSSVSATLKDFFGGIADFFAKIGSNGVHGVFFAIEMLLLLLVGGVLQLGIIYSCVCIGQLFVNKNRKAAGWIAFAVYLAVSQILSLSPLNSAGFGVTASLAGTHALLWTAIVLSAAGVVGTFFLQRYIIKNKVNLA